MNEKKCIKCDVVIDADSPRIAGKYLPSKCKPCRAEYARKWRANNLERSRATARRAQKKNGKKQYYTNKARVSELKARPCMDCGIQYPFYVMDFDHRPGETKEFGIGDSPNISWERILKEVAKCDIVCANCHRERTYSRKQNE